MTQAWKRFEHYICKVLQGWGFTAQRTTSGRQGQEPNVDVDAEWRGIRFAVECKQSTRGAKSYRIYREWFQKLDKITKGQNRTPILVFNFYQTQNGQVWCIQGDHLIKLLEEVYDEGHQEGYAKMYRETHLDRPKKPEGR